MAARGGVYVYFLVAHVWGSLGRSGPPLGGFPWGLLVPGSGPIWIVVVVVFVVVVWVHFLFFFYQFGSILRSSWCGACPWRLGSSVDTVVEDRLQSLQPG